MALLEMQPEITPATNNTVQSIDSPRSIRSIKSLRDIPYMETSFEAEIDTILGERNANINASYFSTPRYSKRLSEASSPRSCAPSESPWFSKSASRLFDMPSKLGDSNINVSFETQRLKTSELDSCDTPHAEYDNDNDNKQREQIVHHTDESPRAHNHKSAFIADSELEKNPLNDTLASPRSSSNIQTKLMDEIAAVAGALASMKEYIDIWAPTTHYVVIAAAALQRDSAAFAASLMGLLYSNNTVDPAQFSTQFYQLREAYSSLLSMGNFNIGINKQPGAAQGSLRSLNSLHMSSPGLTNGVSDDDLETIWDDRQLVNSFMTLLRTSPGFLASTFAQMSILEIESFVAYGDESPLSVLFHGVLGSARKKRPLVFAEVLKCMGSNSPASSTLTDALLRRFLDLALGNLHPKATIKIDRYLRLVLNRRSPTPDFEPILASCIPREFVEFSQNIFISKELESLRPLVTDHLKQFVNQLIASPHQFGILEDIYIGERLKLYLQSVASRAKESVAVYVDNFWKQTPISQSSTELWQPDELIAVKGSDIVYLYNTLLPNRSVISNNSESLSANSNDEDEWCLENIRQDLVLVMQGLAHSTKIRNDGWQIFKLAEDGLMTDIGSDMGLQNTDQDLYMDPNMEAICEAVAHHDGLSVLERLNAYKEDAELRGDHLALLNLCDAETSVSIHHLQAMKQRMTLSKMRCKTLRRMLDRASHDQLHEHNRLGKLLAVLDLARVHVWYETEVRNGTPYFKSREFFQVLYPRVKEEDEYRHTDSYSGNDGLSTSTLGFNFGIGSGCDFHAGISSTTPSSSRSRRLSLLGTHSAPESPFYNNSILNSPKLTDKECDTVLTFMRRNRVRNIIPAEERFSRALVEIAGLARKIVDRDHLASYITFKRDRSLQTQYSQQNQVYCGSQRLAKRNSHQRRSSLSLFDFFDSGSSYSQPSIPLTLHMSTSTQFLGLTSSHDSLRNTSLHRKEEEILNNCDGVSYLGPPKAPSIAQVQALLLSDLGYDIMAIGTETDLYMQQTGRMLLEGDSQTYQALLDDISMTGSPHAKLRAIESLVEYTRQVIKQKTRTQNIVRVSRSDVIHEISKVIGREPGTFYRDLQVVSMLVNPALLDRSEAFEDCSEAARLVIDTVVLRSMDYAARFLRYYMETTNTSAPQMAMMGVNDSVAIWAFCAKQGNSVAQNKLAELYIKFPHLKVDLKPLTRPSSIFDGCGGDTNVIREAVITHWTSLASRI